MSILCLRSSSVDGSVTYVSLLKQEATWAYYDDDLDVDEDDFEKNHEVDSDYDYEDPSKKKKKRRSRTKESGAKVLML